MHSFTCDTRFVFAVFIQAILQILGVTIQESMQCKLVIVCVCVCTDSPWLHAVLQSLQTGLDEVKRLEEQCGAGPTERATHEGFNSWMGLGEEDRNQIWSE